jgi:flagellum-specific peptidoglycan hydrolase FlgJ
MVDAVMFDTDEVVPPAGTSDITPISHPDGTSTSAPVVPAKPEQKNALTNTPDGTYINGIRVGTVKGINETQKEFYNNVYAAAQRQKDAGAKINPAVVASQACLETGYGKSLPKGSSNFFGIKARAGQDSVNSSTKEFVNGQWVTEKANFAKYEGFDDCMKGYVKTVSAPRYAYAHANCDNPVEYARGIKDGGLKPGNPALGGYATDPKYKEQVLAIAHTLSPNDFKVS